MRNLPVRNVVLDLTEHVHDGLVDTEEDAVVDLKEAEELKDLADLGGNADDTADADDKDELGLLWDVEGACLLGNAVETHGRALVMLVLLGVLGSALGDLDALGLLCLFFVLC